VAGFRSLTHVGAYSKGGTVVLREALGHLRERSPETTLPTLKSDPAATSGVGVFEASTGEIVARMCVAPMWYGRRGGS
jgi:hypothetical protein